LQTICARRRARRSCVAHPARRTQCDFIDGFPRHMRDALPHASFVGFAAPDREDRRQHAHSVLVRRILRKHGYPPDKQEVATLTVRELADVLSEIWAGALVTAVTCHRLHAQASSERPGLVTARLMDPRLAGK